MNLTDKCKKEFEKWYESEYGDTHVFAIHELWEIPKEMMYGVLVDFFDSVEICIEVRLKGEGFNFWIFCKNGVCNGLIEPDRGETRKFAIEKANEIYNKNYEQRDGSKRTKDR